MGAAMLTPRSSPASGTREVAASSAMRGAVRRVLLLVALACAAWVAASPATAQDARQTLVQGVARDWVSLVDARRYEDSWKAAGAKFRLAISPARWAESITKVRAPLGALVQRTVNQTRFTRTFQGVPEGDYAVIIFRTAYANRDDGDETLTLEREADGVWRVIGYVVR